MHTATIDNAYTIYKELPLEDKEYLFELIKKQIIESRREALLSRALEAEDNFKKGNIKRGTIQDLRRDLKND